MDQEWLTREQIDAAIAVLSAADLIEAMGDRDKVQGPKMAGDAFNAAAARIGLSNGSPAMQHVRASDFKYLAEKITEVINIDGPLPEGQSE